MIQFPFWNGSFFWVTFVNFQGSTVFFAQRWVVEHCSTTAVATRAFLLELPRPARHRWNVATITVFTEPFFCDQVFRVSFLSAHLYGHYALVFLVSAQTKQKYAPNGHTTNYVSNCFSHLFAFGCFQWTEVHFLTRIFTSKPFDRWRSAPRSAAEEMPSLSNPEAIDQIGSTGRLPVGVFFCVWIGLVSLDMASKLDLKWILKNYERHYFASF